MLELVDSGFAVVESYLAFFFFFERRVLANIYLNKNLDCSW